MEVAWCILVYMETPAPSSEPMAQAQSPQSPVVVVPPTGGHKVFVSSVVAMLLLAGVYGAYAKMSGVWPFASTPEPTAAVSPSPSETVSPTADPLAGWKTYTNTEYGFEVKYPAQGGVEGEVKIGSKIVFFPDVNNKQIGGGIWTISIWPNATNTTERGAQTIFAGKTAYREQVTGEIGSDFIRIIVPLGATELVIDSPINDPISTQILSTFKFTTTATSGWKTYTDARYGFSLRYPPDYRENPFGQPVEPLAVSFVQVGPDGMELPVFSVWVIASTLSPDAWLHSAEASSIAGDLAGYRISTYSIGLRAVVDASPIELGTHLRIFSENGRIVVFADLSGLTDPVPASMQTFVFTK